MTEIVAAMDMSGNSEIGFRMFLSVIVGINEHVRSAVNATGYDHIHMRSMRKKDQERVISRLKIDGAKCIMLCVKVDKISITEKIMRFPAKFWA